MSEYLLFTTTRYDKVLVKFPWNNDEDKSCPFLLRANHYQRLVSAAWDHEWTEASKTLKDYEKFKRLLDEAVQTYKTSSNDADPIALRASLLPLSPHCSIAQILLVDANYNRPRRCLSDHLRTRATTCRWSKFTGEGRTTNHFQQPDSSPTRPNTDWTFVVHKN